MYGTTSMRGMACMSDYDSAVRFYESIKPLRGSQTPTVRPIGRRSKNNTKKVVMHADGSVSFRLYYTDVATYHPDGTVTIEGYRSVTTGSFASYVVPAGVWLYATSAALMLHTTTVHRYPRLWVPDPVTGRYRTNPDISVIKCDSGDKVTLRRTDTGWEPVNVDDLTAFEWNELDRPAARKVAADYRLDDFSAWLRAYTALGGSVDEPHSWRRSYWSPSLELLVLIANGKFVEALEHLPTYAPGKWDRDVGRYVYEPARVKPSAVSALRRLAYIEEDALVHKTAKILDYPTWSARVRRQRY